VANPRPSTAFSLSRVGMYVNDLENFILIQYIDDT
jgi:hypothetical protein